MDTGGHSGSPTEPKARKSAGKCCGATLSGAHRIFTRRRSLVRVQQSPPRKNLGITMVPRFFLCLFLEEKSLFACGIWGYFRVISGLRVAKVLQIFWPSIRCATRVCSFLGRAVCCKLFRQLPCRMPAGPSQQFAAPNFYDYSGYKHSASCPSCCVQPNTESPLRPIQLQKDG